MEELRIKAGSLELSVSGESGTVMEASRDFYNHLAARDQRETEAKMALVEGMRAKMAWYAKEHDEKHQSASAEKKRGGTGILQRNTPDGSGIGYAVGNAVKPDYGWR